MKSHLYWDRLFPAKVQPKQERIFGRPLFWDDLVKMTMSDTPLTKASGRESLFTPLASAKKGATRAGPKKVTPLQILTLGLFGGKRREKVGTRLELRRIGFNWVPASKWHGLSEGNHLTRILVGRMLVINKSHRQL